jgi:membrane-bound lytic murein transglycosylase B
MASLHVSRRLVVTVPLLAASGMVVRGATAAESDFSAFLSGVRREAAGQGIRASTIDLALRNAQFLPHVVELDRKQPERQLTFGEYLDKVVTTHAWTARVASSPTTAFCSTGSGGASMSSRDLS